MTLMERTDCFFLEKQNIRTLLQTTFQDAGNNSLEWQARLRTYGEQDYENDGIPNSRQVSNLLSKNMSASRLSNASSEATLDRERLPQNNFFETIEYLNTKPSNGLVIPPDEDK